jgi:hypothetical protein
MAPNRHRSLQTNTPYPYAWHTALIWASYSNLGKKTNLTAEKAVGILRTEVKKKNLRTRTSLFRDDELSTCSTHKEEEGPE